MSAYLVWWVMWQRCSLPGWGSPVRERHHRWRGGRGVQPGSISRLLQPALLALLKANPGHGYGLAAGLSSLGPQLAETDPALLYRTLREMEALGWIASCWDTAGSGPARRVYVVTSDGEMALTSWSESLASTREHLDSVLDAIKRAGVGD